MPNYKPCANNILKKNLSKKNKNIGQVNYESNLLEKVNKATKRQAKKVRETGFATQFDSIRLDDVEPVGINQSNVIKRGNKNEFDTSLQRDIDFTNDYSEFLPTQMHYGVEDNIELMSSNLNYHSSKRDMTNYNTDHSHRLALNTGVDPYYKSKSDFDPKNIIEPMRDLTYVNGAPVYTDYLETRYIPSNKNNMGQLPFKNNLKVLPGIHGEIDPANTVYRTLPKNVDELRSKTNPKLVYEADKVESGLKGEMRGTDYNLTKYKKKSYRDRPIDDYLPHSSTVSKRKLDPKVQAPNTNRSKSVSDFGHLHDSNKGKKHISKYTETGKITYNDDGISRSVSNTSNKPVLQNKGSFSNTPTQRVSTNHSIAGSLHTPNEGNYIIDPKDIPLVTLRQLMVDGDTNIGITDTNNAKQSYVFSKDFILPVNNRASTSSKTMEGSIKPDVNALYTYDPNDVARQTIKQTTVDNKYSGSLKPDVNAIHTYDPNDIAKQTIKQTTIDNKYSGSLKPDVNALYTYDPNDLAKQTIRQTTQDNKYLGGIKPDVEQIYYFDDNDKPKETIKQTTSLSKYTGSLNPEVKATNYFNNKDLARQTIKQTTSSLTLDAPLNTEIKSGHYYNQNEKARPTIKETTSRLSADGNINPTYSGPNFVNYNDIAKKTVKETTENQKYEGVISNTDGNAGYYFDKKDLARATIKETTTKLTVEGNLQPTIGGPNYINYKDESRPTIKHSTLYSSSGHVRSDNKSYTKDDNDVAKQTVKETTLHEEVGFALGTVDGEKGYTLDKNDKAKTTNKETILFSRQGNTSNEVSKSYSKDRNEIARPTIKQCTLLKNRTGPLQAEIEEKISHEAAENMEIDDRREILTYNRNPNRKHNSGTLLLNKKQVSLKEENYLDRENYGCDTNNSNIGQLKRIFTRNKLALNNPGYRINNDFINTLGSNPLVNDIMHQKNN